MSQVPAKIADLVVSNLGDAPSPLLITAVLFVLSSILTKFIPNFLLA